MWILVITLLSGYHDDLGAVAVASVPGFTSEVACAAAAHAWQAQVSAWQAQARASSRAKTVMALCVKA